MYEVTLTKIESKHDNLRTKEVIGLAPELPGISKRFFMYAESLELILPGAKRYVLTSEVSEVRLRNGNSMIFKTENSLYELKYEKAKYE